MIFSHSWKKSFLLFLYRPLQYWSQILFQHFAWPNDNGNVGVVYTTYIVRSYIIFIGPLVLHTFFIRIYNCFVCINQNTSNISLNTAAACIEIVEMTFFKNERISSHYRDLSSVLEVQIYQLKWIATYKYYFRK
jgi:hypothetical protein